MMLKKSKLLTKFLLIISSLVMIFALWWTIFRYQNVYEVRTVSDKGLVLLNDYEGINVIDYQIDKDGDYCAPAYDVGDGVITFGFGQTFTDEETGISYLNQLVDGDYQVGDCFKEQDLYMLEQDDLNERNKKIRHLDRKYKMNLNQEQFDAIMLMFYLNEETVDNSEFWKMLQSETVTQSDYENYFLNEYQKFDDFATFGEGWTLRIQDSAELYFTGDYIRDY